MSELSKEDITHLAKLSRLTLSDDEKQDFAKQLPSILEFVDQLSAVTKLTVNATEKVTPLAKLRSDEVSGNKLSLADIEKLAPAWRDGQVEVPAVFDN